MKPIPDTPAAAELFTLPREVFQRVIQAVPHLDDSTYLHWDTLRHRSPPDGLSVREWWYALKFKRMGGELAIAPLLSMRGAPLTVSRHARADAAMARMDRLLAGRVAMPEATRNPATRDEYIASSLMEEAIHSSLFEGAASTREEAKDMLRSARAPINRDERMILNNYRAMQRLREMANTALSLDTLLELHRVLTEGTLDRPEHAGRIQTPDDTRIRIIDDRIGRVVHAPPPAEQLPERMQRLIAFANADDIVDGQYVHPVLRSILLHFQLAYDHPFYDGNGRTARALFYWSMLRHGYWLAEFLSISRPIYQRRRPYERAFLEVESDHQNATYFVLQQLEVLQQAVDDLFAHVERKDQAQRRLRQQIAGRDDLNHRQLALLDHALHHPDARYSHESHAKSQRVAIMTARSDLHGLVALGWLSKLRVSKRDVYTPVDNLARLLNARE
jgi:Fic family protein